MILVNEKIEIILLLESNPSTETDSNNYSDHKYTSFQAIIAAKAILCHTQNRSGRVTKFQDKDSQSFPPGEEICWHRSN